MSLSTLRTLFLIVLFLPACVDDPLPPADRDTVIWHKLGEWSGKGNVQTETFTCDSGGLRLRWEALNEIRPGAGRVKMSVHSAVSGRPLDTPVEHRGTGRGTAYFSDDPRIMYVVIESKDVEWSLIVDEAVPGKISQPAGQH
jgi:hypothetical protein